MKFGKLLGKVITAPIKIIAMPFRAIADVADSDGDGLIEMVTDSIEKQTENILGEKE